MNGSGPIEDWVVFDKMFIGYNEFLNVKCAALANNHVTDFDFDVPSFISAFEANGIEIVGFGNTIKDAAGYFKYEDERLVVLNFGWETIKCEPADLTGRGLIHINTVMWRIKSGTCVRYSLIIKLFCFCIGIMNLRICLCRQIECLPII